VFVAASEPDVEAEAVRPGATPLSPREAAVLRLLAEGYTTAEVAAELAYGERSVKNIVHNVTARFQLRNRCHAVAHAIRNGWI
jgi:DNA-binding CsgD family transcriptional regulator